MSISITFIENPKLKGCYEYCKVSETKENGLTKSKNILIDDLMSALSNSLKIKEDFIPMGPLPDNLIDMKIASLKPLTAKIYLFFPEGRKRLIYETTRYEVVLPNILMEIDVSKDIVKDVFIHCLEKEMNLKKIRSDLFFQKITYYKYPFGNVREDGHICFGSNTMPKIEQVGQVCSIANLFFDAPGNSDYYTANRTNLNEGEIRRVYEFLADKDEFPYEILKEE